MGAFWPPAAVKKVTVTVLERRARVGAFWPPPAVKKGDEKKVTVTVLERRGGGSGLAAAGGEKGDGKKVTVTVLGRRARVGAVWPPPSVKKVTEKRWRKKAPLPPPAEPAVKGDGKKVTVTVLERRGGGSVLAAAGGEKGDEKR